MGEFKLSTPLLLPRVESKVTPETLSWDNLTFPVVVKEVGQIDHLSFSASDSSHFAATCSSRIQLYNTSSAQVIRTFSKFRYAAYGGKFRLDGSLLVSGSDEGVVRLFDVKSRSILRSFKGHSAPTHRCDFNKDGNKVISFSDDKSVILWDISSEKGVIKFGDCHVDYIRSGLASQSSEDIFLSGSYDHAIKLLDARIGKPTMVVDHGAPVEALLMFPTGGVFISAGGCMVKVWSVIGGKLLAQMVQHHKTVTCLAFARNEERLLSGSLDRHVKIYDTSTYQTVHTLDYPSPILSIAVPNNSKTVVAGMADGLISIRSQQSPVKSVKEERRHMMFYRYQAHTMDQKDSMIDVTVSEEFKKRCPVYDSHLKKFRHSKALDEVLRDIYVQRKPYWTVTVMQELIRRGALKSALAGRDEKSLVRILCFLNKFILDPQYSNVLMDVADVLITVCTPLSDYPKQVQDLFQKLKESLDKEIRHVKDMFEIMGALETIMAGANHRGNQTTSTSDSKP